MTNTNQTKTSDLLTTKVTKLVRKSKSMATPTEGELPDSKIEDNRRSIFIKSIFLDLTFYVSESSMPVCLCYLMDILLLVYLGYFGSTIAQLCVEILVHMQKKKGLREMARDSCYWQNQYFD